MWAKKWFFNCSLSSGIIQILPPPKLLSVDWLYWLQGPLTRVWVAPVCGKRSQQGGCTVCLAEWSICPEISKCCINIHKLNLSMALYQKLSVFSFVNWGIVWARSLDAIEISAAQRITTLVMSPQLWKWMELILQLVLKWQRTCKKTWAWKIAPRLQQCK